MSVLVKKMKMPYACNVCPLEDYDKELLRARCSIMPIDKNFHDGCPLIEIPPHGRLIDADAFKKYINVSFDEIAPELENGYLWLAKRITEDLLRDIDEAPTVIEAEDGE